ncbi:MAG: hypothetical protein NTU47_04345 [Ignavibacteriales bacterium]|nr:hypothetical protein [Ignavibacteriales bacterium]
MGHVHNIIQQMKQKQVQATTAAPAVPQVFDLPGDHRLVKIIQAQILATKQEYTRSLKWLRDANQKYLRLRAKDKREYLRKQIVATKEHMAKLLTQIGSYSADERMHGFVEVQNAN